MWWALIEEIAAPAEEVACVKEMVGCVRGYHVYRDICAGAIGEVLVCSRELANVGEILVVKFNSRKKNSCVCCVQKHLYNEKRKLRYSIA